MIRKMLQCAALLPLMAAAQTMELEVTPSGGGAEVSLGWNAQPGQTYNILQAAALDGGAWSNATPQGVFAPTVIGEASLSSPARSAFFRLVKEDTDAPVITNRVPRADATDVAPGSAVTFWLSDETAVDPASVLFRVGPYDGLAVDSPGVTWSNNVFRFDPPGDLGGYGEVVTNLLYASDTLGHAASNLWTFTIERIPVQKSDFFPLVAPPDSTMKLSMNGPAVPRNIPGVQPLAGQESYEVVAVTSNSVVFSYRSVIPTVTNGTLLVSFDAAHPFYRQVSSDTMTINTVTHMITVTTTNIPLTALISEGSLSTLDLIAADGGAQPMFSGSLDVLDFSFGDDLSGTVLHQNADVKLWLPSAMWSFSGGVDVYIDFAWGKLKALKVDTNSEFNSYVSAQALFYRGFSDSYTKELGSFSRPYGAMIGLVPVWVEIKGEITAVAEVDASVQGSADAAVGASKEIGFELNYLGGEWSHVPDNPPIDFYASSLDFDINGSASALVYVQPKLTVLVYSLAGPWVDVRPYLEAECSFSLDQYEHALYYGISAHMGIDSRVFDPDIEWELFDIRKPLLYETSLADVAPQFAATLSDCSVDKGRSLTLSAPATGRPAPSYRWYFNGSRIHGVSGAQFYITSANSGHAGEYTVIASNSEGSVQSSCRVTVSGGSPVPVGMALIPGGTNSGTDPDYGAYSLTVDAFYMDVFEVTKAKWDEVYTWALAHGYSFDNAGSGKASNHPVHTVNWFDCVKWCNARSQKEGRTPCYTVSGSVYKTGQSAPDCNFAANGYRLPTNDEWEYAARGGLSGRRFPWGDTITHSQANYYSDSWYSYDTSPTRGYHPSYNTGGTPYTSPVGDFAPNGYGLYDMAGNVWEWCNDASGSYRYVRGGSWGSYAHSLRCGGGHWDYPDGSSDGGGFRTVRR
jgi:formylglycine-generating enzyme required for sulfatase activity